MDYAKNYNKSFGNFTVHGNIPYKLWAVKNHEEMKQYLMEEHPELCFNEMFVECLAEVELKNLVEYKLNVELWKMEQKMKDVLHSA